MLTFETTTGVKRGLALQEISFPITRENGISEDRQMDINKDVVIREDTQEVLGLIPKKKTLIPYHDIMSFVTNEFDHLGVPYKLRSSDIIEKGAIFQSYIFDMGIESPDEETLAPLVTLSSSYIGSPLEMNFGIFRFICANGAMVGTAVENIKMNAKFLEDLNSLSILKEIDFNMNKLQDVSKRYKELADTPAREFYLPFFTNEKVPLDLKRRTLSLMGETNFAEVITSKSIKKDTFLTLTEDDKTFYSIDDEPLFKIVEDESAWDFYNRTTAITTHLIDSVGKKKSFYKAIGESFVA